VRNNTILASTCRSYSVPVGSSIASCTDYNNKSKKIQQDWTGAVADTLCKPFPDAVLGDATALTGSLLSDLCGTIPLGNRVISLGSGLADARVFTWEEGREAVLFVDRFVAFEARAEMLSESTSKMSVLACITEITGMMWRKLHSHLRLAPVFTFAYNSKGGSGATEGDKLPGETDYLDDFLVCKSEHRGTGLHHAVRELTANLTGYNVHEYGTKIVYLPVIAAADTLVEFAIIDVRTKNYIHVECCDLREAAGRVRCFVMAINFYRLFHTMASHIPPNPSPMFRQQRGRDEHILFTPNYVRKRVKSSTCPDELYALLENSSVPHAVRVQQVGEYVRVSPVGTRSPRHGREFTETQARAAARAVLSCLTFLHARGYVHRDIRWDNLIRTFTYNADGTVSSERFLVIDFECAADAGDVVTMGNYIHCEVVPTGGTFNAQHDLELVARLVEAWAETNNVAWSQCAREFVALLRSDGANAEAALQHAWLQQ
jgi:hypothetical protein